MSNAFFLPKIGLDIETVVPVAEGVGPSDGVGSGGAAGDGDVGVGGHVSSSIGSWKSK